MILSEDTHGIHEQRNCSRIRQQDDHFADGERSFNMVSTKGHPKTPLPGEGRPFAPCGAHAPAVPPDSPLRTLPRVAMSSGKPFHPSCPEYGSGSRFLGGKCSNKMR